MLEKLLCSCTWHKVAISGNKKCSYCHVLFSVNQIVNVQRGKCGINIGKTFSGIFYDINAEKDIVPYMIKS